MTYTESSMPIPVALTIAGSDPSGGAGIQADLKTFHQFEVYGTAVITLITVQNTIRVDRVECLDPQLVRQQIRAVLDDVPPAAAKTGALGSREIVEAVAEEAAEFGFPLVVDPVMISKHGLPLVAEEAKSALVRRLIPHAFLLTPNVPEAAALTGIEIQGLEDMRTAARALASMGARAVLIKGGHLAGDSVDLLWTPQGCREFPAPRIATRHTHGTGCTYSAAITAELARGTPLETAVERAKGFITQAIRTNPGLGHGCGPVNHHARRNS
jgi:hydroxymethylpyrimidine/phosphomethylpyrimidine kinase